MPTYRITPETEIRLAAKSDAETKGV